MRREEEPGRPGPGPRWTSMDQPVGQLCPLPGPGTTWPIPGRFWPGRPGPAQPWPDPGSALPHCPSFGPGSGLPSALPAAAGEPSWLAWQPCRLAGHPFPPGLSCPPASSVLSALSSRPSWAGGRLCSLARRPAPASPASQSGRRLPLAWGSLLDCFLGVVAGGSTLQDCFQNPPKYFSPTIVIS